MLVVCSGFISSDFSTFGCSSLMVFCQVNQGREQQQPHNTARMLIHVLMLEGFPSISSKYKNVIRSSHQGQTFEFQFSSDHRTDIQIVRSLFIVCIFKLCSCFFCTFLFGVMAASSPCTRYLDLDFVLVVHLWHQTLGNNLSIPLLDFHSVYTYLYLKNECGSFTYLQV